MIPLHKKSLLFRLFPRKMVLYSSVNESTPLQCSVKEYKILLASQEWVDFLDSGPAAVGRLLMCGRGVLSRGLRLLIPTSLAICRDPRSMDPTGSPDPFWIYCYWSSYRQRKQSVPWSITLGYSSCMYRCFIYPFTCFISFRKINNWGT